MDKRVAIFMLLYNITDRCYALQLCYTVISCTLLTLLWTALVKRCSLQWYYIRPRIHFRTKHLYVIHVRFVDLTSLPPIWGKHMANHSSGKSWTNILSHSQTMHAVHKHDLYWETYPHCAQMSLCVSTKNWQILVCNKLFASDVKVSKKFGIDTCFIRHYNSGNFG